MTTINDRLDNLQFEHLRWLGELEFYFIEMNQYENFILHKYKDAESEEIPDDVFDSVNQIWKLKNTAKKLIENIKLHDAKMKKLVNANGELSKLIDSTHPKVRLQLTALRKEFNTWKESFHHLMEGQL